MRDRHRSTAPSVKTCFVFGNPLVFGFLECCVSAVLIVLCMTKRVNAGNERYKNHRFQSYSPQHSSCLLLNIYLIFALVNMQFTFAKIFTIVAAATVVTAMPATGTGVVSVMATVFYCYSRSYTEQCRCLSHWPRHWYPHPCCSGITVPTQLYAHAHAHLSTLALPPRLQRRYCLDGC